MQAALAGGSSVREVIITDEVDPPAAPDFSNAGGLQRKPEDIVLLQHSSGTTGLQKGVALSHRAVFNQLNNYSSALNRSAEDVIVSWLPLYHDMRLIAGFLMPVLSGNHLVLLSPFEWVRAPHRLMQAVTRYRGTLTWLPNFAYNFCARKIRARDLEGVDLSSLRMISNCSEPMRWESHQAFYERFAPYGLKDSALGTCTPWRRTFLPSPRAGWTKPPAVDEIDREAMQVQRLALPAQPERPSIKMLSGGRPIPMCRCAYWTNTAGNSPNAPSANWRCVPTAC